MLETKDLILRKARFEDWKDLYRNILSRAESAKYMLWRTSASEDDAMAQMERTIKFQNENTAWTVCEKKSGQAIGWANMQLLEEGIYEDCGIAIGPDFVGRGYGKQILSALTRHAVEHLGATAFVASCRSQNMAARGMILSCGFTFTHSDERVDPRDGTPYVIEYYKMEKP